jgi:hypothetical protein
LGTVKDEKMFRGRSRSFLYREQSEQKMNNSSCSSRDRLSCARSLDSRHAITLEGKALVIPFGWNMKAVSEDSAHGPAAKPLPGNAQAVMVKLASATACLYHEIA